MGLFSRQVGETSGRYTHGRVFGPESFDCSSSFGSSSPFPSLSSLLNSASMKFILSRFDILPLLSVSIRRSSSFRPTMCQGPNEENLYVWS